MCHSFIIVSQVPTSVLFCARGDWARLVSVSWLAYTHSTASCRAPYQKLWTDGQVINLSSNYPLKDNKSRGVTFTFLHDHSAVKVGKILPTTSLECFEISNWPMTKRYFRLWQDWSSYQLTSTYQCFGSQPAYPSQSGRTPKTNNSLRLVEGERFCCANSTNYFYGGANCEQQEGFHEKWIKVGTV